MAQDTLWEEGHFLPGVFLFSLPNRKLAPEEAEMLPFDHPGARPSLTTALGAASPGPRRTCHPQTQSRAAGTAGSPRLRGTSSPSVARGPRSRPRLRARPLLRMSARRGSGLPLHCPGKRKAQVGRQPQPTGLEDSPGLERAASAHSSRFPLFTGAAAAHRSAHFGSHDALQSLLTHIANISNGEFLRKMQVSLS